MDIFNTTILCDNCNKVTQKIIIDKDNFKIRAAKCNDCNKTWYHPIDLKEYEEFQKFKEKNYKVKLRMVGNSYCVSIPREIIHYFEQEENNIQEFINLQMQNPRTVSIIFTKRIRK